MAVTKVDAIEVSHEERLVILDKGGSGTLHYFTVEREDSGLPKLSNTLVREPCRQLAHIREFASAVYNNRLYISGGYNQLDDSYSKQLLVFDPAVKTWITKSSMGKERAKHTMLLWKGKLLVTGGETKKDGKCLSYCELYDLENDQWAVFPALPSPRCWHASIAHHGKVYVSGGYLNEQAFKDIWVYEHNIGDWKELDVDCPVKLPHGTYKHKMIAKGDALYFIGGFLHCYRREKIHKYAMIRTEGAIRVFKPSVNYISKNETAKVSDDKNKYDRVTAWSYHYPSMSYPRCSFGVTLLGEKLFITGGTNVESQQIVRSVEIFNTETWKWEQKSSSLYPVSNADELGNVDSVLLRYTIKITKTTVIPIKWPMW